MQALIGLAGVALGALLTALLGYTQERRREHSQTRSEARLLAADLQDADAELRQIIDGSERSVSGTKALAQLKELWLVRRGPLAAGLARTEWDGVSIRVRLIEAPSTEVSKERYAAQLGTIGDALAAASEVLERLERRWRSRLRWPHAYARRKTSALAGLNLDDLARARFLWQRGQDYDSATRYQLALAAYETTNGTVTDAYWSDNTQSAVVLIQKPSRGIRRLLHGTSTLDLQRVSDWATRDSPAIAASLHEYDLLEIRISVVLRGSNRDKALRQVFAGMAHALAYVDTGDHSPEERERFLARAKEERRTIESSYVTAGKHVAKLMYVRGEAASLLAIAAVVVPLSVAFASSWAPVAAVLAGAAGALVSATGRVSRAAAIDFEIGARSLVVLGAVRPLIGAALGTIVYLLAHQFAGNVGPIALAGTAFIAGFAERLARTDW